MRILITTGGSEYSYLAVQKACEMVVRPEDAEIRIISVYRNIEEFSPEPLELAMEQVQDLENMERLRAMDYALKAEQMIRDHFPGKEISISMNALKGSPKQRIVEEAERWNADLIVVGSLGHNFLSRMLIGSVSEAIVRQAHCSVLVVRVEIESGD